MLRNPHARSTCPRTRPEAPTSPSTVTEKPRHTPPPTRKLDETLTPGPLAHLLLLVLLLFDLFHEVAVDLLEQVLAFRVHARALLLLALLLLLERGLELFRGLRFLLLLLLLGLLGVLAEIFSSSNCGLLGLRFFRSSIDAERVNVLLDVYEFGVWFFVAI